MKLCQNVLEKTQFINKCSEIHQFSCLQNEHSGLVTKPISWRNMFVAKYLCNTLNRTARDLESIATLKGK